MNFIGFEPDYRHFADVMRNVKPACLPIYEHILCAEVMEDVLSTNFMELHNGDAADINEFFRHHCSFFKKMTYDVVSYEFCVRDIFPGGDALQDGGAVKEYYRVNVIEWTVLPGLDLVHDAISYLADQALRNIHIVHVKQAHLGVTDAHAATVHGDYIMVESSKIFLAFGDKLRIIAAVSVTRWGKVHLVSAENDRLFTSANNPDSPQNDSGPS